MKLNIKSTMKTMVIFGVLSLSAALANADVKDRILIAPTGDISARCEDGAPIRGIERLARIEIESAINNSGRAEIVADGELRKAISEEVYEQYLSGKFDATKSVEIGKLAGAKYLLLTNLSRNEVTTRELNILGVKLTEVSVNLEASVQMIDVETGVKVLVGSTGKITASSRGFSPEGITELGKDAKITDGKDPRAIALKRLGEAVLNQIYPTYYVIDINGSTVICDFGSNKGAVVGQTLSIMRADKFGFRTVIATAKVDNILTDKCRATLTGSPTQKILKKDVVEPVMTETAQITEE